MRGPRENPLRRAAELAHGRIKVSRGEGLYFVPATGEQIRVREGDLAAWAQWVNASPTAGLGLALGRMREREVTDGEIALFCEGVKQWELCAGDGAWMAYERTLRQLAARCLREKRGGGGLFACWTVLEEERMQDEDSVAESRLLSD